MKLELRMEVPCMECSYCRKAMTGEIVVCAVCYTRIEKRLKRFRLLAQQPEEVSKAIDVPMDVAEKVSALFTSILKGSFRGVGDYYLKLNQRGRAGHHTVEQLE